MPDSVNKYLNKTGLQTYNDFIPHSSTQVQEYVNDWLDAHPEATTTVQDGAITEPKLADESVSLRTLAPDVIHLLEGAILTGNLSGEVLTADDAYSAQPITFTVEGKSTQNGTPTPATPVEIVNLEQPELTFAGKNLCGGNVLLANMQAAMPSATTGSDANGNYIRFTGADASTTGKDVASGMFKSNTQYTVILKYLHSSSAKVTQTRIKYTDGTLTNIEGSESVVGVQTIAFATASGKTVQSIQACWITGTTTIYYDSCGIFEGVITTPDFTSYDGYNVLLQLPQPMRSLTDGTKDLLNLVYLQPSAREGWAWYTPTLHKMVDAIDMGSLTWSVYSGTKYRANVPGKMVGDYNVMSTAYAVTTYGAASIPNDTIRGSSLSTLVYARNDAAADAIAMQAACAGQMLLYQLATPIVTTLYPIELPILPAPNVTVWSDPTTSLQMDYVRDSNIVIQNIEQAIADQ